jgi:NitT/TauT family transport system substrate-binding protein
MKRWFCFSTVVMVCALLDFTGALAQAKSEISVTRQPSILYFPTHIMEKQKLIEKHAARLGVGTITVKWTTFSNGGAQTDAMLSGSVDISNTGLGNMLLLWDRTKGGVKGIVATGALPQLLVTRNPNIKTLKDFGPSDKIAVPTVKVSTQATLIQIACAKEFGPDQWARLDGNTVQLGHPDAYAALSNPQHEVTSHFSAPLFQYYELNKVPGAHVVITAADIIGGPLTQSHFFTTTRFAEANPKIVEAVKAATMEAQDFIKNDTRAAVEIYKEVTGDKTGTDEILEMLKQPGMMNFDPAPQGLMKQAAHMYKVGTLKTMPKAWTDTFLPIAHDLPGN